MRDRSDRVLRLDKAAADILRVSSDPHATVPMLAERVYELAVEVRALAREVEGRRRP